MDDWRRQLRFDPLLPLLASDSEALQYMVRRDLLGERVGSTGCLSELPAVQRILRHQLEDGSWAGSGEHKHPAINVCLIETWRQFRCLVEQYGMTREHPRVQKAAEYLFSCQTLVGDFRGMLANQYATYYTGAIMAVLIEAGYADDPRIEKGFQWLLSMRQDDGGWSIPLITHKFDRATQYRLTSEYADPVEPDRSRPFSHNWTGMVLRAFAVHPQERRSSAAMVAAALLKSRFFQPDPYTSYHAATYWVRFQYPFWWNSLVSALDSLSLMGQPKEDLQIQKALAWLAEHQQQDGLWRVSYVKTQEQETAKTLEMRLWVTLAICRTLKRLYG
ncbi:MAG TPA: prenyltransferase/squalene oxidase repeat-containing protein [Clostridia bacterium]|nr:prenyltransferase/squalene oxidase repeat-containing protein [Clostridia bacterium]